MDISQLSTDTSGSGLNLDIPGLSGLQGALGMITIVSIVLTVLFVVLYTISIVQRVRANRATVTMQKDIAAIRALLEQRPTRPLTPEPTLLAQQEQAPPAVIRDES